MFEGASFGAATSGGIRQGAIPPYACYAGWAHSRRASSPGCRPMLERDQIGVGGYVPPIRDGNRRKWWITIHHFLRLLREGDLPKVVLHKNASLARKWCKKNGYRFACKVNRRYIAKDGKVLIVRETVFSFPCNADAVHFKLFWI